MKIIIIALIALFTSASYADPKYKSGHYKVDSDHSRIAFSVPHLMISSVEGTFTMADGSIDLKPNFTDSKVTVKVETDSIETGVDKRDEHLRSSSFFDTSKFPVMTFVSTKIEGARDHFQLTGELTIKGITRTITFDTHYIGVIAVGYGDDKAAFIGKAKVNRKEFDISWNKNIEIGPLIGDIVSIDLRILATKPSEPTAKLYNGVMDEVNGLNR